MSREIKIEYVKDRSCLKRAVYNARGTTPAQLKSIARSIVEFGIVDPIIARREDGLIIGGHQRDAAFDLLLSGPFKYRGKDPKTGKNGMLTVNWKMPPGGIPVVFLEGVSDRRAKLLNLALNRATGDWEHDKLASLMRSLVSDEPLTEALYELEVTGFSPAEITDYIDIAEESTGLLDEAGNIPPAVTQTPKLSLEFSDKDLRDAVKVALSKAAQDQEPSGETIARMLGIRVRRKKS